MHAIKLTELAIMFAQHAMPQYQLGISPKREFGNSYWLAARFRHEEWSGRLATHRLEIQRPGVSHRASCWDSIFPVVQEVLLAEPLSRLLAYYGAIHQAGGRRANSTFSTDFSALAETTCASHLEARNRCLNLIVFGQGLDAAKATKLNELRQSMEGLTDQLLATLPQHSCLENYAFNTDETNALHHCIFDGPETTQRIRILACSLFAQLQSVRCEVDLRCGSPRLNTRICDVVLKMLPSELFDSFGLAKSYESIRVFGEGQANDLGGVKPHSHAIVPPTKESPREQATNRNSEQVQRRF